MGRLMRHALAGAVLCLGLAGCTLSLPGARAPEATANPVTGDAITVTSLDAPGADAPLPGAVRPKPRPEAATAPAPVAELPEAPVPVAAPPSPEERACVRSRGTWVHLGKSKARTCVKQTTDSGKRCTRESQCQGLCLARSGTCAPVVPLFGCNEIFQNDGRRVTLCID